MTKPIKPREVYCVYGMYTEDFLKAETISKLWHPNKEIVLFCEAIPEPPSKDAETAALMDPLVEAVAGSLKIATEKRDVYTEAHLAGQSIGEDRRMSEICEMLKERFNMKALHIEEAISEIEKRFGGK